MAEDDKKSGAAVADGQEALDANKPQSKSFSPIFGRPDIVSLGTTFLDGRLHIDSASIDGSPVSGSSAEIYKNSEIVLNGGGKDKGLKLLDIWELEREGRTSLPFSKVRSQTENQVVLNLGDIVGGSLEDGESIGIGFFATSIGGRIRKLRLALKYKESASENKDSKEKNSLNGGSSESTDKGSSTGLAGLAMQAVGGTIGGIAGAVASTVNASSAGARTLSQGGTASSVSQQTSTQKVSEQDADDGFDDESAVTELSEQTSAISSTTEIPGGTQTISQGGTVEQTQTGSVSSGTASGSESSTVSGTVSGGSQSQIISANLEGGGGSVSLDAQVSGTAPVGGGGQTISASVESQQAGAGGSAAIQGSADATVKTSVKAEGQVQGSPAEAAAAQGRVSGTANLNQTISGGVEGTTAVGGSTAVGGGTASVGLNFGGTSGTAGSARQSNPAPAAQKAPARQNVASSQGGGTAPARQPAQNISSTANPQAKAPAQSSSQPQPQTKVPSRPATSSAKPAIEPSLQSRNNADADLDDDSLPARTAKPMPEPSESIRNMIKGLDKAKPLDGLVSPTTRQGADPGVAAGSADNISTASNAGRNSGEGIGDGSQSKDGSTESQSQTGRSAPAEDRKPGTGTPDQDAGAGASKTPQMPGQSPAKPEDADQDPSQENSDDGQAPLAPPAVPAKKLGQPGSGLEDLAGGIIGQATSKFWWWGFASAAGTFFTGIDLFVGAIIMNRYWSKHRRSPKIFPMKPWQKFMTVVAYVLPFVYFSIFLGLVLYAGCNLPSPKLPLLGNSICQSLSSISGGLTTSSLNLNNPATNPTTASGTCSAPLSGDASVAYMSNTCFGSVHSATAAVIAAHESGGNPAIASTVDICTDANGNPMPYNGQYSSLAYKKNGQPVLSVSWGLFQINLTANKLYLPDGTVLDCPSAIGPLYTGLNHNTQCSITNAALFDQCVAAATNPQDNIQTACQLSGNGTNWGPWQADITSCKITNP